MKKLTIKLLKDETGSVLPLIAVVIIIFILVGAYQIGSIFVYRDRAVVRDAIDSACTSALASGTEVESYYTNYTEKEHKHKDKDGNSRPSTWTPKESNSKKNIHLDENIAEAVAKSNFQKIISTNKIKASLVSWDFAVEYDDGRYINVVQKRTHTDMAESWWAYDSENGITSVRFPRWVKVTITAKVSVPVLMGGILGKTNQTFTWKSQAIKELTSGSF